MAVPAPASLRDLYSTPSNAWSFVPPSLSQDNSNHTNVNISAPGPSSSNPWSTRTAPNPLFELSSSLTDDDSGLDITSLAKELLAAALLQYATSAIAQPWEVGKTLLQVQWVPRDPTDIAHEAGVEVPEDEGEVRHSHYCPHATLAPCRAHFPYPSSSAIPLQMRTTPTLQTRLLRSHHDRPVKPTKRVTLSDIRCWKKARSRNM